MSKDDIKQIIRDIGLSVIDTDPKLKKVAESTATSFIKANPDLTSVQSEQVLAYIALMIGGLADKGGYEGLDPAAVLFNLASAFGAAALVVTRTADVAE